MAPLNELWPPGLIAAIVELRPKWSGTLAAVSPTSRAAAARTVRHDRGEQEHMDIEGRIRAYFAACSSGGAEDIAAHFMPGAVIYDTNHEPIRGSGSIGGFWVRVRERWGGAVWALDTCVCDRGTAAIEWTMTGQRPRPFTVRGSEHYRFDTADNLIAEIRQYWTFDPDRLDTGLVGYSYASQAPPR